MEATFGAFSDALFKGLQRTTVYSDLRYFGDVHRQSEQSHTLGSWTQSGSHAKDVYEIQMTPEIRDFAVNVVDELFAQFSNMFDEWCLAKNGCYALAHSDRFRNGKYVENIL